GDLSDAVCFLFEADVAVVWARESRSLRRTFCGGYLRGVESCGNSRGGNHFPVAFLPAFGAVRRDRRDVAAENGCAGGSACRAGGYGAELARRRAGGDVELHGLG